MSLECEPYSTSHRGELVHLWNRVFADEPHFRPLTRSLFRERIEQANEGEEFDPDLLWVATQEGRTVGFVHGGLWSGEFLRHLLPDNDGANASPGGATRGYRSVGYLAMIGVDPEYQRQGVGSALVEALRGALGSRAEESVPLLADGRAFNPFYGNFFAPRPVLWGTSEGPAVRQSNVAAVSFFETHGFRSEAAALTLVADLGEGDSVAATTAPRSDWGRFAEVTVLAEPDYQPILGSSGGNSFPYPNESVTWLALVDELQVGSLIAYPLSSRQWAIFSLEVEGSHRGRGIGRRLLGDGMNSLRDRGVERVEALVLPEESPGALRLYRSFQFQEVESWWVFG